MKIVLIYFIVNLIPAAIGLFLRNSSVSLEGKPKKPEKKSRKSSSNNQILEENYSGKKGDEENHSTKKIKQKRSLPVPQSEQFNELPVPEPEKNLGSSNMVLDENYKSDIKLNPSCYNDSSVFNFSYPPINISIPYVEVNFSSCSNCTGFSFDTTGFTNSKLQKEIIDFSLNSTWQDLIKQNQKMEEDECKTSETPQKISKKQRKHRKQIRNPPEKEENFQNNNENKAEKLEYSNSTIPTIKLQQSIFDHRPYGDFIIRNNDPNRANYHIIKSTIIINS
jgi:hypothetical protein